MDSLRKEIISPDLYDKLAFKSLQAYSDDISDKMNSLQELIFHNIAQVHKKVEAINFRTKMIEKNLEEQDELIQGLISKILPKLANL